MCEYNPQTSQYMVIVNEDISNDFIYELEMFRLYYNNQHKEIEITTFTNPRNVIYLGLLNKDNNNDDVFNDNYVKKFINNFFNNKIEPKDYNLNLIQMYKFYNYEQLLTFKF